ncbi:MAG: serine/threonine-protein kinase [Planctomycetota bacterium]
MSNDWFHGDELLGELRKAPRSDAAPRVPGYTHLEEIGRGGQGVVFEALQQSTQRTVAIKVLHEDVTRVVERKTRFEREIELVSTLEHPCIVRVYDSGVTEDGQLYYVMERLVGVPLDQHISDTQPTQAWIVQLLIRIADAVGFAHQRGVMHRDLKPANIIVSSDGAPHILDFGAAKRALPVEDGEGFATLTPREDVTVAGDFLGTLAFASPEQVSGDPARVDIRTDVYALGLILYHCLAGRLPYDVSGAVATVVQSIVDARPQPLKAHSELQLIVSKALDKDPERRYSSAHTFARDLERFLRGDPIEARGDSTWYVLRKTVQKHKVPFGLAALLTVSAVFFAVSMFIAYRNVAREQSKTSDIKIFWEDTLGSVAPARPGAAITFADVLNEAVAWIEITTEGEPEIEASLRTTVGNGYRNLGRFDEAEEQLQRGLALRRELFGPNHADSIASFNAIALLRQSQQRYDEAAAMFTAALDARIALLGSEHPAVAQSYQNLGRVAFQQQRLDEAEALYLKVLQRRIALYGAKHQGVAMVQFDLAEVARVRGRLEESLSLHSTALATRRERLSPPHPDLARSLRALGEILTLLGRTAEAQAALAEADDIGRSLRGN